MKKLLPLTLMLIFLSTYTGLAQGEPCGQAGDDPPGCFLCGPVFIGSTEGFSPGTPGSSGFPCGTIENNFWVSFIAGQTNVDATITSSNCLNGQGVQLIIYDQNLVPVSTCFSSGGNNIPGNVSATGLTPGEVYWIMVDGFAGDICDVQLTVIGGVNQGPPDPPGPITADPDVTPLCPGAVVCYSLDPVNGATDYEWEVPSNATIVSGGGPGDTEVCVEYDAPGGGIVQVTPTNACFPGTPAIKDAIVIPIPPTISPPQIVCLSDFPLEIDDEIFPTPGNYSVTKESYLGCDSVVQYILIAYPEVPNVIDTTVCRNDCVEVAGRLYCDFGSNNIVLEGEGANGCDSIINLIIRWIDPVAEIAPPDSIDCAPNSTITLDGSASSSGNGITYQWTASNGGVLVPPTNQNTQVVSAPGTYVLTVRQEASNGIVCFAKDTVQVVQEVVTINSPTYTAAQTFVCDSTTATYTISPVNGATSYTWTVPPGATFTGSGTSINVTFAGSSGQVCVTAYGPCGQSNPSCIAVTVNPIPTSDFTLTDTVCQSDYATITFTGIADTTNATFTWNFNGGSPANVTGHGPHNIQWATAGTKNVTLTVEENGCTSTQTSHPVVVVAPLQPPVISCVSTTTDITFSWTSVPGANDYSVTINGSGVGTQSDTSYQVTGLNPGDNIDITVIANTDNPCGPSMASSSCIAQNCPTVDLNIDPVNDICRDANTGTIQLTANPTGGPGGGTFEWMGNGTTTNGVFDPNQANVGPNIISLTYTEGTCSYTEGITINVFDVPTSDFTVLSPICNDATSTITYIGTAAAGATFNWDFDGGTVVSGSDDGPYEIQWAAGGNYSITLDVTENGCTSPVTTETVQVDEPLAEPLVNCSITTTSVTFDWDPVPGANNYTVNLVSGAAGTYDDINRTYDVQGLSPGDSVTIEVIANGTTACGPSSTIATCVSSTCPLDTVLITPIGPFCKDGNATPVQMQAVMSSGDNAGTFTFSGPGVSPNGLFDANLPSVNPGTLNIRVTYNIDNCTYQNTLPIIINPQPSAAFTVDNTICVDSTSTVTYAGGADPAADYNWDFGTGAVVSGSGPGPYEIKWSVPGNQQVSLVVTENNCPSEADTMDVQVDDLLPRPNITCETTQNDITFTWDAVSGAQDYNVNLLAGNSGTYDNLRTYFVDGLVPGDQVEIEVIANGTTACGPSRDTIRCEAIDCPDITLVMPSLDPYCLYPDNVVTSFNLDSMLFVQGSSGNETRRWHDGNNGNSYVTVGGTFFPNAVSPGVYTICVEWTEPSGSTCVFEACADYEVNGVPTAGLGVTPKICITDEATAFVSAPMGSTFQWDFGSATVVSGSGKGPYQLSWSQSGIVDTIRVIAETNGCFSDEEVSVVEIDPELTFPNVNCTPSNTTVEFSWDSIPGATDYTVNVISGAGPPASQTNTFVLFDGLTPQTEVTIELIIDDSTNACPPVVDTLICIAKQCPQTVVSIDPLVDTCITTGIPFSTQLNAVIQNDSSFGAATSTWSSMTPGIVSPTGLFTPPGPGSYNIQFEYAYDGCTYRASKRLNVYATPTADFTVDSIICETNTATVTFTGNAPVGSVFNWDFDGGNIESGSGSGPYVISWNTSGARTITLEVTANGCTSPAQSEVVQVDPELDVPNIRCDFGARTTSSVGWTWDPIPGATEYEILLNDVSQGTQTGTSYQLSGLSPDSTVLIQVIAIGNTVCGNSSAIQFCTSEPCPPVTLDITPVAPICFNEATNVILEVDVQPNPNAGTGVWSGASVSQIGVFDPIGAGVGTHTATFTWTEKGCVFDTSIDIVVNAPPTADAGTPSDVLDCITNTVNIGGASSPNAQYTWEWNGAVVGNTATIAVDSAGTYTLTVFDPTTGCSETDEVVVLENRTNPQVQPTVNDISCFGRSDGVITANSTDGQPPFLYSLNGSAFSSQSTFSNLVPGEYTIRVQDANGCEDETSVIIIEPDSLTVELGIAFGENPLQLGDSVLLQALVSVAPDLLTDIVWSPIEEFPLCDEVNITNCLTQWVQPDGQTFYTVRIETGPGCADEDNIQLNVEKVRPIYIPTGFSPNNLDGFNDVFHVYADPKVVTKIKSFLVFDRWGEMVFEAYDFSPSLQPEVDQPELGWDGTLGGQKLNSNVFVYFVEVEYFDGITEILKGDVTLR